MRFSFYTKRPRLSSLPLENYRLKFHTSITEQMSKEPDESIQIPQAEEEQFPESGKRPAAIYAEFVSQTRRFELTVAPGITISLRFIQIDIGILGLNFPSRPTRFFRNSVPVPFRWNRNHPERETSLNTLLARVVAKRSTVRHFILLLHHLHASNCSLWIASCFL